MEAQIMGIQTVRIAGLASGVSLGISMSIINLVIGIFIAAVICDHVSARGITKVDELRSIITYYEGKEYPYALIERVSDTNDYIEVRQMANQSWLLDWMANDGWDDVELIELNLDNRKSIEDELSEYGINWKLP